MNRPVRDSDRVICEGGCHCGAVRFRLRLPMQIEVRRCTCSICRMTGYEHLTVRRDHFELVSGEAALEEYRFHSGVARHLFCRHCGIKSFYVPRSHPHAYSVHLACVDLPDAVTVSWGTFDGANWDDHVEDFDGMEN